MDWEWGLATNGCQGSSRDDGNVLKLNCGDDCTIQNLLKITGFYT